MKHLHFLFFFVLLTASIPASSCWACATCSVPSEKGQWFMLVSMLTLPCLLVGLGALILRHLLKKSDAS